MKTRLLVILILFVIPFSASANRFVPKSDLIQIVLNFVENQYVDPNRLVPEKMLEGALENLSRNLAPVVTFYEKKGNKVYATVKVDRFKKEFIFSSLNNLSELNRALQEIVRFTKQHIDKNDPMEDVDYAAINGFLKKLDPHSSLLIPDIYSEFSTDTQGSFGGIGVMIGLREGKLTIISPIDGTPGSQAGLKAKDHIVQINDESTVNMSLIDAVKRMRGQKGSKVDLYIMRKGFTSKKKFTITRGIIKITSLDSSVLELDKGRIGYIKLKRFQQNTLDEMNRALKSMDFDLSDFKGIILDLRNNPGGLLDQAIRVSDRFLPSGVIVSTAGLDPSSSVDYKANWFHTIKRLPLVILVNNGSASASEIVSAALKKNKRALLIGGQTFGKGSVQQIFNMRDGSALKLTISKYLTPGKSSIQSVGVTPDIALTPYQVTRDFVRIVPTENHYTEAELDEAFSEWGNTQEEAWKKLFYYYEDDDSKKEDEEEDEADLKAGMKQENLMKDYSVSLATEILQKNTTKSYDSLKKTAEKILLSQDIKQKKKLENRLNDLGILWKDFPSRKTSIQVESWLEINTGTEEKPDWKKTKTIKADSTYRLYLKAKNQGKSTVSKLIAVSKSEEETFNDKQLVFGSLKPGDTNSWYLPLDIPASIINQDILVDFVFKDANGKEVENYEKLLNIKSQNDPFYSYSLKFFDNGDHDSKGNGNGKAEPGETIAAELTLINKKGVISEGVTALLKNGEGTRVYLKKGRNSFKELKEGKAYKAYYLFDLKEYPLDNQLDFSLDILDGTFPLSSLNQKLRIDLTKELNQSYSNEAPDIQVGNYPLSTAKERITLSGSIADDKSVKEAYIFVNEKKVYYQNFFSNKTNGKVTFKTKIDLNEKVNKIAIFARDEEKVVGRKYLKIRKQ